VFLSLYVFDDRAQGRLELFARGIAGYFFCPVVVAFDAYACGQSIHGVFECVQVCASCVRAMCAFEQVVAVLSDAQAVVVESVCILVFAEDFYVRASEKSFEYAEHQVVVSRVG